MITFHTFQTQYFTREVYEERDPFSVNLVVTAAVMIAFRNGR